jgi:hypothetical protein
MAPAALLLLLAAGIAQAAPPAGPLSAAALLGAGAAGAAAGPRAARAPPADAAKAPRTPGRRAAPGAPAAAPPRGKQAAPRPRVYGFNVIPDARAVAAYDWDLLTGVGWIEDPALVSIARRSGAAVELRAQYGLEPVIADPARRAEWVRGRLGMGGQAVAGGSARGLGPCMRARLEAKGGVHTAPPASSPRPCLLLLSPMPLRPPDPAAAQQGALHRRGGYQL